MHRDVRGHTQLHGDLVPGPRLGHGARHAIEHVSAAGCLGGDQRLADDAKHDLLGHQLAPAQVTVNGPAEIRAPGDLITQQVTHHDARHAEVGRDQVTLRPLARTRWPDHQYPHLSPPRPGYRQAPAAPAASAAGPPGSPPTRRPSRGFC